MSNRMVIARYCILFLFFLSAGSSVSAQNKQLDFFIKEGLNNNPALSEINNLQQYFHIQNEFITAQNKKPQVSFTADYLFAPFFFDNGRPISITTAPSSKAFGYDAALTNGGLYSAQVNLAIPLFNTGIVKRLYEQNKIEADISTYSRNQIEHDIIKNIIDQYIVTYQFQQQAGYLRIIINQLEGRKPLVAALVTQGLLQQNDFLLLDIQLTTNSNDLKQLQFAYNNGIALLKNLSFISDTTHFELDKPLITIKPITTVYNYIQKFKLDSLNLVARQNVFNNRYKPQVSLLGSTGINAAGISNIPHNIGLSAGVHVSIPISDGHQRTLYEKQNSLLLKNQLVYFNSAALIQQNNLRYAKQQIEQWQQTIEMAVAPIQKQELLLEIIKDKVVKGQVSVMDYINALQEYAFLQKNKAIAETNLLLYINQYNYYNW
ncbi:MAG: TolC family protein [Chitinophagaceae bacterium]